MIRANLIKIMLATALLLLCFFALIAMDTIMEETSDTYHDLTEEIKRRHIDTVKALNFNSDETSSNAVFEAQQTTEHPPAKELEN